MASNAVHIDGLSQFVRNLKKLDADLPKVLRVSFNDALTIVVDYARPRVPAKSGKARGSIKTKSTRTQARVSAGGRKAPYYPWLDFGGRGPNNRPAPRPFHRDGRYLWHALVVKRDEFHAAMTKALVGVAEQAGIEVD